MSVSDLSKKPGPMPSGTCSPMYGPARQSRSPFLRSPLRVPRLFGPSLTDGLNVPGFSALLPALESVREQLADPTSDRVIEVLLIAHEWGGELVATVLSDLADEITEDLRTGRAIRAEGTTQRIESWVVGIVPWLLLIYLTATQGPYRTYYQTGTGRFVILAAGLWWGMGLIVLGMMKKQEREPRVLGSGAEENPV